MKSSSSTFIYISTLMAANTYKELHAFLDGSSCDNLVSSTLSPWPVCLRVHLLFWLDSYFKVLVSMHVCVLSLFSHVQLCDPMDCSPAGSSVCGTQILQARILEWIAITFSRGSSWPRDWTWGSDIAANSLPSEPTGKQLHTDMCIFVYTKFFSERALLNIC